MSVSILKKFLIQKMEMGEKSILLPISKFKHLNYKLKNCNACRLRHTRTNVVFGEGDVRSKLLMVGEAPGYYEDLSGRPFVGEAGQLLTDILSNLNLKRMEIYITNLIKCRPPDNRDPRPDEIKTCSSFLSTQIKAIGPSVLVTLGRYAAQHLLNCNTPIHNLRGKIYNMPNFQLIPTLHPAYILRNPAMKKHLYEDLKTAAGIATQRYYPDKV